MLTQDEKLWIGLKTIERLRPGFMERLGKMKEWWSSPNAFDAQPPTLITEAVSPEVNPEDTSTATDEQAAQSALPLAPSFSLQEVIQQLSPVKPGTLILGMCEDGLPFLLDLTNPAPGSLLIAGDVGSGKTRLMKSILASLAIINSPDQVMFNIITASPEEYGGLSLAPNCRQLLASDDSAGSELLLNLSELLDTRRHGKLHGPTILLAIDDLASCTDWMTIEEITQLYRLIRHGPRARIWVVATLTTHTDEQAGEPVFSNEQVLSAFRTRLIGKIDSAGLADFIGNQPNPPILPEAGSDSFAVPYGDGWVRFWICDPEPVPYQA